MKKETKEYWAKFKCLPNEQMEMTLLSDIDPLHSDDSIFKSRITCTSDTYGILGYLLTNSPLITAEHYIDVERQSVRRINLMYKNTIFRTLDIYNEHMEMYCYFEKPSSIVIFTHPESHMLFNELKYHFYIAIHEHVEH